MSELLSKSTDLLWKNKWNIGIPAVFSIGTYNEKREQGNGAFSSLLYAGAEAAYYAITPLKVAIGADLIMETPSLVVNAAESANQQMRSYERMVKDQTPFRNYTFVDGPQIYTMRQAGLALAQKSKYQLQQAMMGNEAQYMHR